MGIRTRRDFGRKFKVAFSGCDTNPCALVRIHDLGAVARVRDGKRGFEVYVGGGLGTVPYQAKLFDDFVPEEEIASARAGDGAGVRAAGREEESEHGPSQVSGVKLGLEEFKRLVLEERAALPHDPRWTDYLKEIDQEVEEAA